MVRPNPRYDPVNGTVTTPTTSGQPRPNPRYGTQEYIFVNIDGYSRNLVLEKRLDKAVRDVLQEVSPSNMKIRFPHTRGEFLPQAQYPLGIVGINDDDESKYGWGFTFQTALDYIKLSKKYHEAKINLWEYQCNNYPKDPAFCQHATQFKANLARINKLIPVMEARAQQPPTSSFDFIPQVFAEEEPSIMNGVTEPELIPEPVMVSTPEPVNETITENMIIQRLNNFSIINGRAVGSITFTATGNFNPFYYNKTITNVIQFKTPNGVNILPFIKQNTLRFTATERTETIHYDESMENNTRATLESFVWSSVTQPTAFSKPLSYQISETDAPKPVGVAGIMGAGVAGAIGILILLGFVADSRRKK